MTDTAEPMRETIMRVRLAGSPDWHELHALNPDFLTAELRLPKMGLPGKPKQASMTYMTAVAWAAAKRTGLYSGELRDWLWTDCELLDIERDPPALDPTDGEPDIGSP